MPRGSGSPDIQLILDAELYYKDNFYLPKNMVDRFDGHNVWFKITKEDAEVYRRD
jgi:hypothetical protein